MSRLNVGLENCSYKPRLLWIFLNFSLVQTPWHIVKFVWCILYCLVAMTFGLRELTDRDIIAYVEGTTLGMLITKDTKQKDLYSVVVNKCLLKLTTGRLESFKLSYSRLTSTIVYFELNGEEMHTRELIMSVIFTYHTTSIHTKCHLFSNSVTTFILDQNMEILEPATITSIPLHNALIHSTMSAVTEQRGWYYKMIGQFYTHPVKRSSLIDESKNFSAMKHHETMASKRVVYQGNYMRYLMASRLVLGDVLDHHNLPPLLLDPLFNHTIVHSTDHYNIYNLGFFR